jgi:hypothetical protein
MQLRLGIDIACRAPHQASLADEMGAYLWTGRRFRTRAEDLERLWAALPAGIEPTDVLVIMEPTRNAWVALAAWLSSTRSGCCVGPAGAVGGPTHLLQQAHEVRSAGLPLAGPVPLHPEGLHPERSLGPGDPMRRATRMRQTLVKRRTQNLARLDAPPGDPESGLGVRSRFRPRQQDAPGARRRRPSFSTPPKRRSSCGRVSSTSRSWLTTSQWRPGSPWPSPMRSRSSPSASPCSTPRRTQPASSPRLLAWAPCWALRSSAAR